MSTHQEAIRAAINALDRFCTPDDMEEAILAYLLESGLSLTARDPTSQMVKAAAWTHEGESYLPYSLWQTMHDAALKPFPNKEPLCDACEGTGFDLFEMGSKDNCKKCNGRGTLA